MRTPPIACAKLFPTLLLSVLLVASQSAAMSWDVAPPDPMEATPPAVCPNGDTLITSADALIALRRGLDLISAFICGTKLIPDSIVDVAPPMSVDSTQIPPVIVAGGDGVVNSADALLILRAAVGLISLIAAPPEAQLNVILGTVPTVTSVGEVDLPPLDDFPNGTCDDETNDCDCNEDGILDPPDPAVMRVVASFQREPDVPFDVCMWLREDASKFDFDAPPLNNFPGPEDHDGLGDGLFNNPPPPNPICVTVCPNNQPDPPGVDCVEVDLTANQYKQGIIVPVGPIYPDMLPPSGFEFWTAVVDPGHALADTNFSDNVLQFPELVPVRQCPDLSPDLLPTGTNVIPSRPNQFDDISFEVSILNQGEAPTRDSFDVDFYVDLPPVPVITFPTPSGQSPIPPGDCFRTVGPGLAIGQEITLPCTNFGGGPLNLAPGLHSVMVLVDSIGQFGIGTIVESDETNNVHPDSFFDPSSLFCVGSSLDGFGNPDLAISKIRFIDRNTRAIACDRKVDDVVDIELTIANRDVNPLARDLDISRHNSLQFYEVRTQATFGLPSLPACFSGSDIECTDLDGLTFDCVPLGPDRAPLVGQYKFPLIDTTLRVEVQRVDFSVPQDVDLTNNTVDVPLLNKPPVIDAGPAKAGTVGVPIRLAATASDPNDVPAGSQPLTLQWTVVSKPMGAMASFDQSSAEDPLFSGDKAGAYTLRLSGQDCATAAPVTDTVVVTLNPGPPGP